MILNATSKCEVDSCISCQSRQFFKSIFCLKQINVITGAPCSGGPGSIAPVALSLIRPCWKLVSRASCKVAFYREKLENRVARCRSTFCQGAKSSPEEPKKSQIVRHGPKKSTVFSKFISSHMTNCVLVCFEPSYR